MRGLAFAAGAVIVLGCAGAAPAIALPAPSKTDVARVIDGWHSAASRADEESYFNALADDAVFLGTDATERWQKVAFRAYAHPHFAKGKAWSFRSTRRDIAFDTRGEHAWFDEDLETPNLGPARGSGVLRREGNAWKIVQYNLAVTVPNDRFKEVRALLQR